MYVFDVYDLKSLEINIHYYHNLCHKHIHHFQRFLSILFIRILNIKSTPLTKIFKYTIQYCWRRQWHPTPVLLPGKSHGRRSLVGCSPWGREESNTQLSDFTFTFHFHALEKEMTTHSSFLPGESQGRGSLVGCHLWGYTESDTTEVT